MLTGERHWTEAGTNAGRDRTPTAGRARIMDRARRLRLINDIAGHFGGRVTDWANSRFIVKSYSGRSEIVDNLPRVWMSVETLSGKDADPLDEKFLAALDKVDAASG